MKPNFALILSMDGIALLQRSSPGWALVGDAYPDDPNLADTMAKLRAMAEELEPGNTTFKVVIPNDQIRYLTIPAGSPDPALRRQEVEAALDGATPYALDELAVDHAVSGTSLQIAAVALETLQEADEFARGFGFDPLSFVAMPEGKEFAGEPYFGTAHDVPDDIDIEPDRIAIRVSGRVRMPDDKAAEAKSDLAVVPPKDDAPEADKTTDAAPVSFSSVRARGSDEADPKEPSPSASRDESDSAPRIHFETSKDTKTAAPVVVPPRDIQPEELSSSLKSAPQEEAEARPSPLAGLTAKAARLRQSLAARRTARAEARAAQKAEAERLAAEKAAAELTAPTLAAGIANPVPNTPQAAPETPVEDQPAKSASKTSKKKAKAPAAPKASKGGKGRKAAPVPAPDVPPEPPAAVQSNVSPLRIPGALNPDERRAEAERLTVFGARNADYDTGKGGAGTLVVGLVLILFMIGTAGWTFIFSDQGLAAMVGADVSADDTPVVAAAEESSGPVQDSFIPPAPSDEAAAADTEELAETLDPDPADEPTVDEVSPLIVTEAATAPAPDESETAAPTDDAISAEEEARYAASGIWQDSPGNLATSGDGASAPEAESPGASDTPPERGPDVDLAVLTPDARPAPPAPPAIFGKRFNMDDRGLVIATPDGAETPSGVLAFAGDPPVVPPARPGDPEPAQEDQPEADPASDAQLQADPTPAVETNETDVATAIRPKPRPGSSATPEADTVVVTEDTDETPAQDDVVLASAASLAGGAVEGAGQSGALITDESRASLAAGLASGATAAETGTEEATTAEADPADAEIEPSFVALRPLERPGNIAELAARVVQEPPPAIKPSGPTAVSVARQATLQGAINLREINLIGVYGQPSDRRALVRLSNGRYRKVKVGDRIDGGRILAIGDDSLRYQSGGQSLTLNMPNG